MEPLDPLPGGVAASDPVSRGFGTFQRSGDREALANSLLACTPELMLKLRQLSVPLQDQPDLVQECFAIAIRRSSDFDSNRRLQPWLLGILTNLVRAHRRDLLTSKSRFHPLTTDDVIAADRDPIESLDLASWRSQVQSALSAMPTHFQSVLQEHLIGGLSPADIAARLRRKPSTVRTQLERGLRELRRRLPAPLLVGLVAVEAAGQARVGEATVSGGPQESGTRWLRWTAVPGVVAVLGVALAWSWWPDASSQPSTGNARTEVATGEENALASDAPVTRVPAPVDRPAPTNTDGEVRIRLSLKSGGPAAGVAVILEAPVRPGEPLVRSQFRWRTATTDATGAVVFRDVPPGNGAIRLHDFGSARELRVASGTQTIDLPVEPRDRVRVKVVDASGAGLAGAKVWVSGSLGKKSPGYAAGRTDESGFATIAVFLPKFYLWGRVPGRATTRVLGPVMAGAERSYTLQTEGEEASLRVCIEEDATHPLSGAIVAAWSTTSRNHPPAYGRTNQDGRAVLDGLLPGPVRVVAVAEGVGLVDRVLAPQNAPKPGSVRLRVQRGGVIRGRIVGFLGEQAASTRILSQRDGDAAALNPFAGSATLPAADGTFVLRDLASGDHHVAVFSFGESTPKSVHRVHVDEGEESELQIVSHQTPIWKIRVVDRTDQPLAGSWLRTVSPVPGIDTRHDLAWRIDAEGFARVPRLGNAPQIVSVHMVQRAQQQSPGVEPVMETLPVLETKPMVLSDTTIVVPNAGRKTGRVQGRVPASYRDPKGQERMALVTSISGRPIPLPKDGVFAVKDVPPGEYRLRLELGNGAARYCQYLARFTLAPGQELDLGLLPDPGAGVLTLRLPASAAVVPLAFEVRNLTREVVATRTIAPGESFEYRVAAGAYTVCFASSTAGSQEQPAAVTPGGKTSVTVARTAGRPCRIRATSPARSPTPSPVVGRLRRLDSGNTCRIVLAPELSRTGWVADLDLAPGRYRIEIDSAWGPRAAGEFEIGKGAGRSDHVFRLQ